MKNKIAIIVGYWLYSYRLKDLKDYNKTLKECDNVTDIIYEKIKDSSKQGLSLVNEIENIIKELYNLSPKRKRK